MYGEIGFAVFVFNLLNNYLSFHLSFSRREETSPKYHGGFLSQALDEGRLVSELCDAGGK